MSKIKKLYFIVSILLILTLITSPLNLIEVQGIDQVRLVVNGKDITELSEPIIVNDRTLVPIRFVFEEIGREVQWDGKERSCLLYTSPSPRD